jgi:hypothetical protein
VSEISCAGRVPLFEFRSRVADPNAHSKFRTRSRLSGMTSCSSSFEQPTEAVAVPVGAACLGAACSEPVVGEHLFRAACPGDACSEPPSGCHLIRSRPLGSAGCEPPVGCTSSSEKALRSAFGDRGVIVTFRSGKADQEDIGREVAVPFVLSTRSAAPTPRSENCSVFRDR